MIGGRNLTRQLHLSIINPPSLTYTTTGLFGNSAYSLHCVSETAVGLVGPNSISVDCAWDFLQVQRGLLEGRQQCLLVDKMSTVINFIAIIPKTEKLTAVAMVFVLFHSSLKEGWWKIKTGGAISDCWESA